MAAPRRGGAAADELRPALAAYAAHRGGAAAGSPAATSGGGADGSAEDWRFDLVASVGEECVSEEELRSLLRRRAEFNLYDGFEPSGRMHIAQGVFKAVNVNKCTRAGGIFIFWVADWFALMNDKMGGDLEKIKTVGQYFIEVWKATGMDMSRVRFRWSSDDINSSAKEYWGHALDIARKTSMVRIKRCCQIMGREEDKLTAAQIMYPIMQCTDIFFLKADICQLGLDQRKVNMLAREYSDAVGRKTKPIILSHHMLYGLAEGQAKMSKSNPDSAIFMEDSPADVARKIRAAYCPKTPAAKSSAAAAASDTGAPKDDLMNPCLDYIKNILFSLPGYCFVAGGRTFSKYEDVKAAFLSGQLSEEALKDKLIEEINKLLDPVRTHFSTDATAKELLAKITKWKKEDLKAPSGLTRLTLKPAISGKAFVVFAPLPRHYVRLEDVLGVVSRLRQAPADGEVILWLEDWTAQALDCVGASEACIQSFYDLLLFGARSIAPDLVARARVCRQSEQILAGPSDYWISVINAGRWSSLDSIRAALPAGETLDLASQVFATLMHIGDILALAGATELTLCCDAHHEPAHRLAAKYCQAVALKPPSVQLVDRRLRLFEPGEGAEVDVNIMLTDKDVEVNKKIKKCFCMPQNIEFCPPIAWVEELLAFGSFDITRKPDNGGDKSFAGVGELVADFESGALHPGDFKPALARALNAFLSPLREELAKQDALKRAQKDLENHAKAQSKKK